MRDVGVKGVQCTAQTLAGLPQFGRRVSVVLTIDPPASATRFRQDQRHTGDAPELCKLFELLGDNSLEPVNVAHTHTLGDLPGHTQALLAAAGSAGLLHQITDVEQLQKPLLAVRLNPAACVQDVGIGALEVQIEHMPQPFLRHTLDHQRAVGQQQTHQAL